MYKVCLQIVTPVQLNKLPLPLKTILHYFNVEQSNIALFVDLFEHQAKKSNLKSDELVINLLTLLPLEIAELILREPADKVDDICHMKSKLLERFKMNFMIYRQKFSQHQQVQNSPWKYLILELISY